ncbi:MATE family efflux transporter [Butyrivibrio sp. WCD3002]|uniref:MATE family efflux transporter n=1 Tax=Butyrivibrio sp. WCD3002 TaxID=1280676 RepID=UPI00041AE683|nr:MATE family efflux transporter [Butyrivibrio sp. WCD3002]
MNAVLSRGKKLFGPGKFYINALSIAVPIMLQQLIQSMVSLVDNFMVSGLGDIAMSGVNVAGQVMFIFMVYVNTICTAGGIFMTQYYGAKDKRGMGQAFRFKLIMGLAAAIPYYLVCRVYPRQILSLMVIGNTQADAILDAAVSYIGICFFIGIQMTISVVIASSLRDLGKVNIPLVITVIATLINTCLNWVLIYGHFGLPALGVNGAAYATVIARSFEFIAFIAVYAKLKPDFMVRFTDFIRIDVRLFGSMAKKGALVLFCEMVWVLSETVTTAIYNGRGGADVVSGMASGFAIANLFFVAFSGIYSATGVIIGKTLGTGNLEEARVQKKWLLSGAAVLGFIMTFVGFGTTLIVPVVFGRLSDSAVGICRSMVILLAFFMPAWVLMNAQQAIARAGGDTEMGMYTDAFITILVMLPMLFILARYTNVGPVTMYLAVKLLDLVKVVIFHFWLRKERWLKNLTVPQAA